MEQALYNDILNKIGDMKYVNALFFTAPKPETRELLKRRSVVFVQDFDNRTPGKYLKDTFDLIVEDTARPGAHPINRLVDWAIDGGYIVLYGNKKQHAVDYWPSTIELVNRYDSQITVCIVHKMSDGRKPFQYASYIPGSFSEVIPLYRNMEETVSYDRKRHQLVRIRNGITQLLTVVKDKEITTMSKAPDLSLNVSQQCNMRCRYCFVDPTKISRERVCEKNMSFEIADQSIRWYKAFRGGAVRISLFGGEPLVNLNMVKRLISKYKEDNEVTFSLVTNGTLLDEELIRFCVAKKVDLFVSLDGNREQNDLMRKMANGDSSHDLVLEKMNLLPSDYFQTVKAMMTITKHTNSLYESIRYVIDCGFSYLALSFIKGNEAFVETAVDLKRWDLDISKVSVMAYEGWLNRNRFIEPFATIFDNIAGKEMLFVQPDGCISPCYRFVTHIWGNVYREGINRERQQKFLAYKQVYRDITCSYCWANRFCQGGCTKDLPTDLKIKSTRCGFYQTILKRSLIVYAKKFDENRELLKKKYRDIRYSDLIMSRHN